MGNRVLQIAIIATLLVSLVVGMQGQPVKAAPLHGWNCYTTTDVRDKVAAPITPTSPIWPHTLAGSVLTPVMVSI